MSRAEAMDVWRLAERRGLTPSRLIRSMLLPLVREELERKP